LLLSLPFSFPLKILFLFRHCEEAFFADEAIHLIVFPVQTGIWIASLRSQ